MQTDEEQGREKERTSPSPAAPMAQAAPSGIVVPGGGA